MKQKVIAIVGMPGAGKTEAADFFKAKKIPILRFGDQTDIGVKEAGKPLTEENERWYREKIRKELGMAAYAIKIHERLTKIKKKSPLVILDGLRSWEEYIFLSEKIPDFMLLCIYSRPVIRYQRLSDRKIRSLSPTEARKRDVAEVVNLNMGNPIAMADYLIQNETSISQFRKELETFLQSIQ